MKPMVPNAAASPATSGERRAPRQATNATTGKSKAPSDQHGIGNGLAHHERHRPIGELDRDFQYARSGQRIIAGVRAPVGQRRPKPQIHGR